jgi:hypothetical protein
LVYFNLRPFTIEIDGTQGWLVSSLHGDIRGDGSMGLCLSALVFSPFKPEPGRLSQLLPISIFLQVKDTDLVAAWFQEPLGGQLGPMVSQA